MFPVNNVKISILKVIPIYFDVLYDTGLKRLIHIDDRPIEIKMSQKIKIAVPVKAAFRHLHRSR